MFHDVLVEPTLYSFNSVVSDALLPNLYLVFKSSIHIKVYFGHILPLQLMSECCLCSKRDATYEFTYMEVGVALVVE